MQDKIKDQNYFFVDESGDPVFYNKYGKNIVGTEGCSKILILGFVLTDNPRDIRLRLEKLRQEIISDTYFSGMPSIEQTKKYFHAKDDCPEVREKVFKLIATLDFKAEFIVARKKEKIFKNRHAGKPNVFYDDLIVKLFFNKLHLAQKNIIYFEVRGSRERQQPLEDAMRVAINTFESKWGFKNNSDIIVHPMSSIGEPCLQIIDYMNWALQRAFVKGDDRYVKFLEDKISMICDVYDSDKYPKNYYSKNNKFDTNKISPL